MKSPGNDIHIFTTL